MSTNESDDVTRTADGLTIIDTSRFVDDALGDYHKYPQPKREPNVSETEVRTKNEGSEFERNRYIGRSDPNQATYFRVSIEEPLNIPIRVYKIRDPPLFPDRQFPDRSLELNIGSVENARKLYEALGRVLAEYDRHEQFEETERDSQ